MAYIGKEPIVGNFQKCDAITVVNGQAAYTLQVSSTNVVPESANHMLVSLNGILQAPAAIVKVLPLVIVCEDPDVPAAVKLVIDPSVPEKLKCTPTPSVFENDPLDTM